MVTSPWKVELPSIRIPDAVTFPVINALPLINAPEAVILFVITSPSACKWKLLDDISMLPFEPDMY